MFQADWILTNDSNTNIRQVQQQLQSEVGALLKVFDDVTKYVAERKNNSSTEEKRIIILEDTLAIASLPLLRHLHYVVPIFIYSMDSDKNILNSLEQLKDVYEEITVSHLDNLVKCVQASSQHWYRCASDFHKSSMFNIYGLDSSSTNINSYFLLTQLLVDQLLSMKSYDTDLDDFCSHYLKILREKYKNDKNENCYNDAQKKIEELRANIHKEGAVVEWYTKNALLHDILNTSFRTNDLETIFRSRFVIREIYQQLMKLPVKSPIQVYRGQLMSKLEAELLSNSIGRLMSMKSFLSTSLDRKVAEFFTGTDPDSTDEDKVFVIFSIGASACKDNQTMRPFGDITGISNFGAEEKEILFMAGSVFRIECVTKDSSGRWIISMTMCHEEDIELNKIFSWIKNEKDAIETNNNPYYNFVKLLVNMGMPNEARKFCLYMLNEYDRHPPKNIELAKSFYMLAKATFLLEQKNNCNSQSKISSNLENQNKLSLISFEKALAHIDQTAENDFLLAGEIHHSIANVYQALNGFEKASDNYFKAIEYYQKNIKMTHRLIAELYADLGRMFFKKNDLSEALFYFQCALCIADEILPETHLEMGIFHMNLVIVYATMNEINDVLYHIRAATSIIPIFSSNDKAPLNSYHGILNIMYEYKEFIDAIRINQDNVNDRQPIVMRNQKIHYKCPWCYSDKIWVYREFSFLKGSPCFQCLRKILQLLLPQMHPNMALNLEYFARRYGSE